MKLLVINGPNLNMLGIREPEIYGTGTYENLIEYIRVYCLAEGIEPFFFQSNHEGAMIDEIHRAYFEGYDGIIINPGGLTHTSVSLADAIKAVNLPCAEVHLSNVNEREGFRRVSYIRELCVCTVSGQGFEGYRIAAAKLLKYINFKSSDNAR